ncbi:hypothetical protein [Streptomyces mirabilis]|uniref:hypothetical protein n=1 Tax=Streptomyces mirabilis TaxID=68239 RepID=UPI0036E226A4
MSWRTWSAARRLELSRRVNVPTAKADWESSLYAVTVLSTASADEIACPRDCKQ